MTHFAAYEELSEGQIFETDEFLVTSRDIRSFAEQYDPQPMHLDEVAAQQGPFSGVISSGWQTLCLTMRLMVDSRPFGDHPLIGVAVDSIQFKKPVVPDTRIRACAAIVSKRKSAKIGRAFVKLKVRTLNADNNEELLTQIWTVMLVLPSAS
jgi:acyl dehydratase